MTIFDGISRALPTGGASLAFVRRTILLTLMALSALGCGEDPPVGCVTSNGCDVGSTCIDGFCEVIGTCSTDLECHDTNACNGEESCDNGRCVAGQATEDSSLCDSDGDADTLDVCGSGMCAPGRCGDGFLDEDTGEVCDDGNDRDGDGCDDCRFSCIEDEECDDGSECNGVESCEDNACVSGEPLAEGADCAGTVGTCTSDVCLPKSCETPGDCDDGNVCTGMEDCVDEACVAGPVLDCDDESPCTDDTCHPLDGCAHRLIDTDFDGYAPTELGTCGEDCDDDNPLISPASADGCDGEDNDCDGAIDEEEIVTYYSDCDGDRYAAADATVIEACAMPTPTLTRCEEGGQWTTVAPGTTPDCNDANATVRPGQAFQSSPILSAPEATDFDYNCDGTEELERTAQENCVFPCVGGDGFVGNVPACGETGTWALCRSSSFTCRTIRTTVQQRCR